MKLFNWIIKHFDRVASLNMHGQRDSVMLYLPAGEDTKAYFYYRDRPLRGDLSEAVTSLAEPESPSWFSSIRQVEFMPVSSEYAAFPFEEDTTEREYVKQLGKWVRRLAKAVSEGDGKLSAEEIGAIFDRRFLADTGGYDIGAAYLQFRGLFPGNDGDHTETASLVPGEELRTLVRDSLRQNLASSTDAPAHGLLPENIYVSRNFITLHDLSDDETVTRLATQADSFLTDGDSYSLGLDSQTFVPISGAMDFLLPVFVKYDVSRSSTVSDISMTTALERLNRPHDHQDEFIRCLQEMLPVLEDGKRLELVSPDFVTARDAIARFRSIYEKEGKKVLVIPE